MNEIELAAFLQLGSLLNTAIGVIQKSIVIEGRTLRDIESEVILRTLENEFDIKKTAKILGISRETIYRKKRNFIV